MNFPVQERNGMKSMIRSATALLALCVIGLSTGFASDQPLPVVNGKEIVATVNGEPITKGELNEALVLRHADTGEQKAAGRVSYTEILDRLVNSRLFLLEARNMGLDELPEVREDVDKYSRDALLQVLLQQQTKDVTAEEGEVEEAYRQIVKEYKLRSLLFENEEEAKRVEAEIASGKEFQAVVEQALARGDARGAEEGEYIRGRELLPEIEKVVTTVEIGTVSPVIRTPKGYALVQVEEIRYPDDPVVRQQARGTVLDNKKAEVTIRFIRELEGRYATVHKDVLDGLDFEADVPGFEALLKDRRAIAEIAGEDPVTVGDLSDALRMKYFHGVDRAVKKRSINKRKWEVFDTILRRRVVRKEALRRGVEDTATYRDMVGEYENTVLFGVFMQKVIRPGLRLEEKEVKEYYEKHPDEFSYPERVRIDAIVFSQRSRAEETVRKLKEGTDFSWLAANAEGQVDENSPGLLQLEGNLVPVTSLSDGVRDAVSGADAGEYRLYESPEGYHYLLAVREILPPHPLPYEMVRNEIARKMINEKAKKELDEYAGKLREVYPVEVFLKESRS